MERRAGDLRIALTPVPGPGVSASAVGIGANRSRTKFAVAVLRDRAHQPGDPSGDRPGEFSTPSALPWPAVLLEAADVRSGGSSSASTAKTSVMRRSQSRWAAARAQYKARRPEAQIGCVAVGHHGSVSQLQPVRAAAQPLPSSRWAMMASNDSRSVGVASRQLRPSSQP